MFAYYTAMKHSHLMFVIITLCLLNFRFFWKQCVPNKPLHKIFRIIPHINDTLLLITGAMMAYTVKFIPFANANWLGTKLILLLVYIGFGFMAIKSPSRSSKAWMGYVLSMLSVGFMIYLAIMKPF
ncbi:SirB2 family protein [Wohlfahrtiimonas larvae]|uniref:SirB2 family protein n=1 Tax=Wohlfahrtiimonas larvae TaxID=1157986 RepID=A0ABP9MJ44_9GAMM|nr:SirB2 family protein [Wohlfahrtiimonas larvae]